MSSETINQERVKAKLPNAEMQIGRNFTELPTHIWQQWKDRFIQTKEAALDKLRQRLEKVSEGRYKKPDKIINASTEIPVQPQPIISVENQMTEPDESEFNFFGTPTKKEASILQPEQTLTSHFINKPAEKEFNWDNLTALEEKPLDEFTIDNQGKTSHRTTLREVKDAVKDFGSEKNAGPTFVIEDDKGNKITVASLIYKHRHGYKQKEIFLMVPNEKGDIIALRTIKLGNQNLSETYDDPSNKTAIGVLTVDSDYKGNGIASILESVTQRMLESEANETGQDITQIIKNNNKSYLEDVTKKFQETKDPKLAEVKRTLEEEQERWKSTFIREGVEEVKSKEGDDEYHRKFKPGTQIDYRNIDTIKLKKSGKSILWENAEAINYNNNKQTRVEEKIHTAERQIERS